MRSLMPYFPPTYSVIAMPSFVLRRGVTHSGSPSDLSEGDDDYTAAADFSLRHTHSHTGTLAHSHTGTLARDTSAKLWCATVDWTGVVALCPIGVQAVSHGR